MAVTSVVLNKTFSVVTDNSVSTYPYRDFVRVVCAIPAIVLSGSSITRRQFNKYKEVLYAHGFTQNNVIWYVEDEIGNHKVCSFRISFYKVGIATTDDILGKRKLNDLLGMEIKSTFNL